VLELARSGKAEGIAGYATFHGGLATPEGQAYASGTPPLFIAHGGADASITMDDVAALSRELERAVLQRLENELQPALAALNAAVRAALREAVANAVAQELQSRKLDAGALAAKRSAPSGG
jgi:predicted esterase